MTSKSDFDATAVKVSYVYGTAIIYDEDDDDDDVLAFICPECGEPIYFEDWEEYFETANTFRHICPICDYKFEIEERD